jgi:diguanylate cyclase (GGDEF)-like protein/PAS domain S-box-containing protein
MPHRFRALFQHTQDAVLVADQDGLILEMNPAAATRFGVASANGEPTRLRDLLADPNQWAELQAAIESNGQVCRHGVWLRGWHGEAVRAELTCVALQSAGGMQLQAIVHAPGADAAAQAMDQLFDPDTGFPNRAAFVGHVQRAHAAFAAPAARPYAVIHADLNRFQRVNEALGHERGNELLALAAQRLEACVRPGDVVARAEGDDFLVLLNGLGAPADAVRVAERMARALHAGYRLEGQEVFCGADVGVVVGSPSHADAEQVMRDAESAMAASRLAGTVQLFEPGMHEQSLAALRLHADLRYALEREELRLYYQPIVGLADGRVRGFEALVRWQHPVHGLVPPADFIPIAEDTGLIIPIGAWVLERAAMQLADWHARFPMDPPLGMGINLSVRQFARAGLAGEVQAVLERSGVDAATLKLEVTESVVMGNADAMIAALHELKALGVQLQVDDFGTGYSSLSYLHQFPLDVLKIDRSFIVEMVQGEKHLAIVRAIIALASALGLETTAEGVDDAAQVEQLREMGCTYGQGYLWGRPMTPEDAERLIAEDRRSVTLREAPRHP